MPRISVAGRVVRAGLVAIVVSVPIALARADVFAEMFVQVGHTGLVANIAFSPDGRSLASVGGSWSGDRSVKIWEVASGRELRTLTRNGGWIAMSPDGALASQSDDDTIRFWELRSGRELSAIASPKSGGPIALSPDGRIIAAGRGRGAIDLWNVERKRKIGTLNGDQFAVFSPDGRILATGTSNSSGYVEFGIALWDVVTGAKLRTLTGHTSNVNAVAFAPNGRLLASGSSDSTVQLSGASKPGASVARSGRRT